MAYEIDKGNLKRRKWQYGINKTPSYNLGKQEMTN